MAPSATPAAAVVVGVDVGGTKIAAATVDAAGALGPVIAVPTPAADGPVAVLDAIAGAVRRAAGGSALAGVGVGTAGAVDPFRGTIVSSTATFAGWVGTPVADGLRARLGDVPVLLHNDVDAHALGEAWLGAAAGATSVLMVAAGTGIGGALLLDGRLRTGHRHLAGEIGHVPAVGADDMPCPCGRSGHLEALAAGPAIARRYRELGGVAQDARAVVAAAEAGDDVAAGVVRAAADGLGRAIAGMATLLDPALVVVGGGLPQIGPRWWGPFERALRAELVDAFADLAVAPARLGPEAAIVGAARAVRLRGGER